MESLTDLHKQRLSILIIVKANWRRILNYIDTGFVSEERGAHELTVRFIESSVYSGASEAELCKHFIEKLCEWKCPYQKFMDALVDGDYVDILADIESVPAHYGFLISRKRIFFHIYKKKFPYMKKNFMF